MMKVFVGVIFSILMVGYINLGALFFMNFIFILSFFFMFMYISDGGVSSGGGYYCLDSLSFPLILLSVWVTGLMILCLMGGKINGESLKVGVMGSALLILIMFFSARNLLIFYFFFEVSLIPAFLMIFYWGGNLERVEASFYMIIYMLFISLPLLVYLVSLYKLNLSLSFQGGIILGVSRLFGGVGVWDFSIIFGAFFIKLPLYLFHIWLPKAHVEAPVWGSMLLAAVLLKMGGYGVMRLSSIFILECYKFSGGVFSVAIVGGVCSGVLCLVQVDLKSLVAYSSVVHMNLMLAGIFTLMKLSVFSAMVIMVSHGLCSSGLFFMVNMFYQRVGSRLLVLNKGQINKLSKVMIWWFLLCSSNFSFPFSLNFIGEISVIMVLLGWWNGTMIPLMLICFLSGAYSLYLFVSVGHTDSGAKGAVSDLYLEHLGAFLHLMPLLLGILNLSVFKN